MNKHVNKVRKATGRAEAITAGRQQNKQQYLIIQLIKKKESIKTEQERQQSPVRELQPSNRYIVHGIPNKRDLEIYVCHPGLG